MPVQDFRFSPLDKGMHTQAAPGTLPPEAFTWAEGCIVTSRGPERVPGLRAATPEDIPLAPGESVWKIGYVQAQATRDLIAMTNKRLWRFESTTWQPVPWAGSAASWSSVGVTVAGGVNITLATAVETGLFVAGDCLVWRESGVLHLAEVASVADSTHIVLVAGSDEPPSGGTEVFTWSKTFGRYLTSVQFRRRYYIADCVTRVQTGNYYPLLVYGETGGYLRGYRVLEKVGGADVGIRAIRQLGASGSYLWYGGVDEGGTWLPSRIRWSDPLTPTIVYPGSYQDLPTEAIVQAFGFTEQMIVAFTEAGTYYGRPVNLIGRPYQFLELPLGDVGVLGERAWAVLEGAVVFACSRGLGYIDSGNNIKIEPTPMFREIFAPGRMGKPKNTVLTIYSPMNILILAYTSQLSTRIDRVAVMDLTTKAWSFWNTGIAYGTVATSYGANEYTWTELAIDDVTWAELDASGVLWEDWLSTVSKRELFFVTSDGQVLLPSHEDTPTQFWRLITGDLTFDAVGIAKTVNKLVFRVIDGLYPRTALVEVVVEASEDRGNTWKALGTLRIPYDTATRGTREWEDEINFRMTGHDLRFRLTSESGVPPWTLESLGYRVQARGGQVIRD